MYATDSDGFYKAAAAKAVEAEPVVQGINDYPEEIQDKIKKISQFNYGSAIQRRSSNMVKFGLFGVIGGVAWGLFKGKSVFICGFVGAVIGGTLGALIPDNSKPVDLIAQKDTETE